MVKIAVCGASGKMGKMIIERVLADKDLVLSGAVEVKGNSSIGNPIDKIKISDDMGTVLISSDVIIDFTTPEATLEHLEIARKNKKSIVIGTTGITEPGIKKIENAAKEIPVVFAPNMSVGVNLLFKLVNEVASILSNYDVEIIEAHHNQKKDSPSGTALKLAEIISKKLKLTQIYGRFGTIGARKKEIGIHSVRAGDIVGDHTVIFAGPGERLELIHRAHSRETFAAGAVEAAKWLFKKNPGLYNMQDVLGLK